MVNNGLYLSYDELNNDMCTSYMTISTNSNSNIEDCHIGLNFKC